MSADPKLSSAAGEDGTTAAQKKKKKKKKKQTFGNESRVMRKFKSCGGKTYPGEINTFKLLHVFRTFKINQVKSPSLDYDDDDISSSSSSSSSSRIFLYGV